MTSAEPAALLAARALHAEIASRGDDLESGRRLPADLARRFAQAGIVSVCVPARYGSGELAASGVVRMIEEIARADGAAGGCVKMGATTGMLAASLPDGWARETYDRDPTVVTGGVTAPNGIARPTAGGHRVTGRWSFGSGCQHSDWLVGGTRMGEGDAPETRLTFFARGDVQIRDTWFASGLRGSGSHDFEVADSFVPEGRSVVLGGRPRVTGPLYQFPTFGLLALDVCGVALGIARLALDEFVVLADGRVPTGSARTLANRPVVQRHVGEAEAALRSARAFVFEASSPLQRCFRDVHVATQHIMVAQPIFEVFGRAVLGLPVDKSSV